MDDPLLTRSLLLLGPDAAPVLRLFAALTRLLPVLTDHDTYQRLQRRCGIAPQRIVSLPWHPGRLADARRKRAAGTTPPLVHVTRVRLPSQVWYLVTDGMHRAWAAREAGLCRLGAYIDGEVRCQPEDFQLRCVRGSWELWRRHHPRTYLGEVRPDVLPTARALGVSNETA
jgi:hypothetical protein